MLNYPAAHNLAQIEPSTVQPGESSATPTRTDIKVTVPSDAERALRGSVNEDDVR